MMTVMNQSLISGPICPEGYKPKTDRVGRILTYEIYKKLEQCAKNCTANIIDGVPKNCKGFRLAYNLEKPLSKRRCSYNPRALGYSGQAEVVCIKGIT